MGKPRTVAGAGTAPGKKGTPTELMSRLGTAELASVLVHRPDAAASRSARIAGLVAHLSTPRSLTSCLNLLDVGARQVLEALVVATSEGAVTTERLAGVLGVEPADAGLTAALGRLMARALALPAGSDGGRWALGPGVAGVIRNPARLAEPAVRLLAPAQVDLPGIWARLTEPRVRTGTANPRIGSRSLLLELITDALADPELVTEAVTSGPPGTDQVAANLAWRVSTPVSGSMWRPADDTPVGWLLNRGLLAPSAWNSVSMPREAALVLRGGRLFEDLQLERPALVVTDRRPRRARAAGPATPAAKASQPDAVEPDAVEPDAVEPEAVEAAVAAVGDVEALLVAWEEAPVTQLQSGGIGVRELRKAAKVISRSEEDAFRLAELAELAGLLGVDREHRVAPGAEFDAWREAGPAARWLALARGWWESILQPSPGAGEQVNGRNPALTGVGQPGSRQRRLRILEQLATVPSGGMVEQTSLTRALEWEAPGLFPDSTTAARVVGWTLAEASLLGLAADGALTSLGRCLAAGDPQGAARLLEGALPAPAERVVFQPDLTAVAAGPLTRALQAELELLADTESTGAATVFRFSEASLRRGFDAGRRAEEIIAFLEGVAERGVPQTLSYLVSDVARRFGRLRVGSAASYVVSDDTALLTEVIRHRRTAKLGLRALAPSVLVSSARPSELMDALRDAGFLPAREGADGTVVVGRARAHRAPLPIRQAGRAISAQFDPAPPSEEEALQMAGALLAAVPEAPPAPASTGLGPDGPHAGGPDRVDEDDGSDDDDAEIILFRLFQDALGVIADPDATPDPSGLREPDRPTHIARHPAQMQELLGLADAYGWLVRISAPGARGGREVQLTAGVDRLSRWNLTVTDFDTLRSYRLDIRHLGWVRVLTEAEEEACFGE